MEPASMRLESDFRGRRSTCVILFGSNDLYGPCKQGIIIAGSHGVLIKLVDVRRPDRSSNKKVLLPGVEEMVDFTADENPVQ
jgi:hypothetical protein